MQKKFIFVGLVGVLLLAGLIWATIRASNTSPSQQSAQALTTAGSLKVSETFYDFGTISMKNGKVTHDYKIKNTGSSKVEVKKVYTSCMCTMATMMYGDYTSPMMGMPGHGSVPEINKMISPKDEFIVQVEFDPNAHGPAGVGPIARTVFVETTDGQKIELNFKTEVTP